MKPKGSQSAPKGNQQGTKSVPKELKPDQNASKSRLVRQGQLLMPNWSQHLSRKDPLCPFRPKVDQRSDLCKSQCRKGLIGENPTWCTMQNIEKTNGNVVRAILIISQTRSRSFITPHHPTTRPHHSSSSSVLLSVSAVFLLLLLL